MRDLITVFPHIGLTEFGGILEGYFAKYGWQLLTSTEHHKDQVFPSVGSMLSEHPGARAFVGYDVIPANGYEPTTVLYQFDPVPVAWDPLIIRALSEATRGWAYGILSDRQRLEFALGVFYAGGTLEAARTGDPLNEHSTRAALVRYHQWIARGDEQELHWQVSANVRSWLALPPVASLEELDGLHAGPVVRSVFVHTTDEQVRSALSTLVPSVQVNISERASAVLQTPFTVVDGPLSQEQFTTVAKRLGCAAAWVDVLSLNGTFFWSEATADGKVRSGKSKGALQLATVLGAMAQYLDEPVSAIR